jgi:putative Holliday junction resolvase
MTPAAAPATLLAFDFGTRRTGVAVGNTLLRQAQPLATLA